MAVMNAKFWGNSLVPERWAAYCWLPFLACLLTACHMPSSVRHGESPLLVEGSDRLQFPGLVKVLVFSQGGRTLIAGGCEVGGDRETPCTRGFVALWNLKSMMSEATLRFPNAVLAMAVSPDGTKWVAGDSEGRLILSTTAERGVPIRSLHQKGEITALAFSPDGQWVASGSLDTLFPLGLMEMKTGGVIRVKVPFEPVSAVAFSRDGKDLGVGMQNGSVVVWSIASRGTPVSIAMGSNAKRAVSSLAFSPDDRLLAYGRQDGQVVIVDRVSGLTISDIRLGSAVTTLAFSPDGRHLALGQDNGKVVLIESDGAREIWSKRHIISVADLAYSPDGTSLAVAVQQGVFIYQLGDTDSTPGTLPRAEHATKTKYDYMVAPSSRQARSPNVSSRKFSRVLEISQDEFFWLLPFDRLIARSVEAMQKVVPGSVIKQGDSAMPGQMLLAVGGRSLAIDLNRLRLAEGKVGLREAVEAYEWAQQVLLAARPGATAVLEDVAVSAILAELGPGVRLVPQSEVRLPVPMEGSLAKGAIGKELPTSFQMAEESLLGDGIRYLKLASFSRSTAKQVQRWVARGTNAQRQSIAHVLDLRDNSGGDLGFVVETADSLLPKGKVIAELIVRKTGESIEYRSKGLEGTPKGLVVLVNERTAGTAELLACAIQESRVGALVGTGTSGVDDIYGLFPLPGGDALRVSIGRFLCPGGHSLRWKGQPVAVEAGRVSSMNGMLVGMSQADSFSRSRLASPLPTGLPVIADNQLRIGIEVAKCLGRIQLESHAGTSSIRHGEDLVGLLSACRMNLH